MRNRNQRKFFLFSLFIFHFSLFTFLSCRTAPPSSDFSLEEDGFVPLSPGALVYVFADVQKARPILDKIDFSGMESEQLQQMLDITTSALAAIYEPQKESRYQLVSWGNYPASKARIALGFSKGWKSQRSAVTGASYWYSEKDRLAISLNQRQAWVLATNTGAASTDPFSPGPGTPVPPGFGDFGRGAVLSCWLDNPGPFINLKLQQMGIPIELPAEMVFIRIVSVEDQYEGYLQIQVSNEAQARALATILTLARAFMSFSAPADKKADSSALLQSILFANPPVQEDKNLNIKTNILSSSEIALLFNIFSL